MLWSSGNMDEDEALLVCFFLELATHQGTYPRRFLALATVHYAQMVWLK